jgi:GDP/UDP-N,N'-diacetylbacillosamine 2-epimerase (hydrolysing)
VINCEPNRESIQAALQTLYSETFQSGLTSVSNPYGKGGASEAIVNVLAEFPLENIRKKQFYDLLVNDFS